jgi:methionyl-tRNA formyltransferase
MSIEKYIPELPYLIDEASGVALGQIAKIVEPHQLPSKDRKLYEEWISKIIKFIEINRSQLKSCFLNRFSDKNKAGTAALNIFKILLRASQGTPTCFRSLNSLLHLLDNKTIKDVLVKEPGYRKLSSSLDALMHSLTIAKNLDSFNVGRQIRVAPDLDMQQSELYVQNTSASGVVVFSPNRYSLQTVGLLHLLKSANVKVEAVVTRRLMSLGRLREELRFSIRFLYKRILNEVLFRGRVSVNNDTVSLRPFIDEIGCQTKDSIELAKSSGAKIFFVSNFNSSKCLDFVSSLGALTGVYIGGGIVREELLSRFKNGMLHAHPGILPQYRGMDVVQWAILEVRFDQIGVSTQLMTAEIDAGPLVSNRYVSVLPSDNLIDIRRRVVEAKIDLLAMTVISSIKAGACRNAQVQSTSAVQYFLMHPFLIDLVKKQLASNCG